MVTPTKNPAQYYTWHHFVLMPLALLIAGYTILRYTKVAGNDDQTARLWFSVAPPPKSCHPKIFRPVLPTFNSTPCVSDAVIW